jgi:hypothetical protein
MADTILTTGSSSKLTPAVGGRATSSVGGYETDAATLPFIKEQDIGIYAVGMKPNTPLHTFFDNVLMNSLVTPATLDFTITNPSISDFHAAGVRGSGLTSDALGRVSAIMHIPAGTFFTGDRLVMLADVSNLNNIGSATTSATFTFHAFNYSTTKITDSAVIAPRPAATIITNSISNINNATTITNVLQDLRPAATVPITAPWDPNPITPVPPVDATVPNSFVSPLDPIVTPGGSFTLPTIFDFNAFTPFIGTEYLDPIAQGFYISDDGLRGADGIFASSVDLYFQRKDPDLGITVEIRTMENGIPTTTILPFSRVHIPSSSINTSVGTTLNATKISFESPVFLAAATTYALVVIPDGNNPNYRIHTAAVGQTDVATGEVVTKNWGSGDLFTSTNGSTWVPIANEFLKFTLYIANFTSASGSAVLTNKDYEFIVPTNLNGWFEQGEYVFQSSSNVVFANSSATSNTVTVNAASYTVTLNGLTGTLTTANSFSAFNSGSSLVVSNGSAYDVLVVNAIANTTTLTVKNLPKFSSNVATVQFTPVAKVYNFDPYQYDLTLDRSTAANTSFLFGAGNTVIGITSGANAQINQMRDRVINKFNPYIQTSSVKNTVVQLTMKNTISSTYANTAYNNYDLHNSTYVLDNEIVVASKSNEITNMSGRKSLTANIALATSTNLLTPQLDMQGASLIGYRNLVTNAGDNENTKNGTALNKYISKTITLASGLDSEDLYVYISAYKPANTYINVYGKFLSSTDPESFDSKDWTLLEQVTNPALYSDPIDLNDIKEYQFTIPTSPPSTPKTGVLTTSTASNTVTGIGTAFTTDIAANDLIKLWSDSTKTSFQIVKVTSVANSTSISIDNNASFTSTVASYEKITLPRTAFINDQNYNAMRYYSNNGIAYDTYITYAIKIDLLADNSYRVPRVLNLRAIATV